MTGRDYSLAKNGAPLNDGRRGEEKAMTDIQRNAVSEAKNRNAGSRHVMLALAAAAACAALAGHASPADAQVGGGFSFESPDGTFSFGLNFDDLAGAVSDDGGDTYISNTYVNETPVNRGGQRGIGPGHRGRGPSPRMTGGPGRGRGHAKAGRGGDGHVRGKAARPGDGHGRGKAARPAGGRDSGKVGRPGGGGKRDSGYEVRHGNGRDGNDGGKADRSGGRKRHSR
jgi:hypothetical protein